MRSPMLLLLPGLVSGLALAPAARVQCAARCVQPRMAMATQDAAKLFGRFAEKQLYLDKAIGAGSRNPRQSA